MAKAQGHHIVWDIETAGVITDGKPADPVILSIGAVDYSMDRGEVLDTLYIEVDKSCEHNKQRTTDSSTMLFWSKFKGTAAHAAAFGGTVPLKDAMRMLDRWIREHRNLNINKTLHWAKSTTFDLSILRHAYDQCNTGVAFPAKFFNERDVRTALEFLEVVGINHKVLPFEGTKHNALDDAIHEARLVHQMFAYLRR